MNDRSQLTGHSRRFPDLEPEANPDDSPVLRPGRSLVAIVVHNPACAACRAYVETVLGERAELDSWDADIAVIVCDERQDADSPFPSIRVVHDPGRAVAGAAGLQPPGVVIVDQWRDITDVRSAGEEHEFPGTAEIVSCVRYLAIRCPECEGESL